MSATFILPLWRSGLPRQSRDILTSADMLNRRSFLATAALAAPALAQRDWSGKNPTRYPDPDVIVLDPRFAKIKVGNASIERLHVGCRWAEGPAWNAVGKYLVWSDIPNDRQLRWIDDDAHVST